MFGFLHTEKNCLGELIVKLTLHCIHIEKSFFIDVYSFSIIYTVNIIFIVYSNSRNELGWPDSNIYAVILFSVAGFIKHVYMEQPNKVMVQYEIQYSNIISFITQDMRRSVERSRRADKQREISTLN